MPASTAVRCVPRAASFTEESELRALSKLISIPPAKAMVHAVHSLLLTLWPTSLLTAGVKTAVSLQCRDLPVEDDANRLY